MADRAGAAATAGGRAGEKAGAGTLLILLGLTTSGRRCLASLGWPAAIAEGSALGRTPPSGQPAL